MSRKASEANRFVVVGSLGVAFASTVACLVGRGSSVVGGARSLTSSIEVTVKGVDEGGCMRLGTLRGLLEVGRRLERGMVAIGSGFRKGKGEPCTAEACHWGDKVMCGCMKVGGGNETRI